MTTRHQYRLANRRLGRDRAPIDAAPAPRLGEMLQLARERKGVDLFRAERDTKIRLRYLAALEDSDFDELPAAVYTKGFLRNYAIYLGLDPNEALERWRAEMEAARSGEKMVVAPPPQPLASPRQMINLSPGMLVTAVVLIAIVTFVGYVALQLMRYTDVPAIELTNPAARVSTIDADSVELSGTTVAGALISIHAPGDQLLQATANENGAWSHEVPLARGRNDFSIVALDPVTQRESEPYFVIITVPLPIETPGPTTGPSPAVMGLQVTTPADGLRSESGRIRISGTTSAARISITSERLDLPPATPEPTDDPTDEPPAGETPAADASPTPSPAPPARGPSREVTVGSTGRFSETLEFAPGRWQITITAFATGVQPRTEAREVLVTGGEDDITLLLEVVGGRSWVRIETDGELQRGLGTLTSGFSRTFTASEQIRLRTGNAGALRITLNGEELGLLGAPGEVGRWIFLPGQPPERTTE